MSDNEPVLRMLAKLGEDVVAKAVEPEERIVLIAFQVKSGSQMHAQQILMQELQGVSLVEDTTSPGVVAWWVAMDERHDRNDCESAVLVQQGMQAVVQELLVQAGLAVPADSLLAGKE